MFTEIHCIITGKVQRVGYRDFVERIAKEYGLTGWVKNREDGSVEVVYQGIPDALKEATQALHTGSVLAKVEGVAVDWRTPERQFDEFKVISNR
jgi:acylphosphatase